MDKKFKLAASDIKRLIPDMGGAIASDMITVEGKQVEFMERGVPTRDEDSGWLFYGGGETQEYLDEPGNCSIFDLNTIANYDPEIIRFLTYSPGTAIERNAEGKLELVSKDSKEPSVVLLPAVEAGPVRITVEWTMEISSTMTRRVDENSLVVWRPGFTIWIDVFKGGPDTVSDRVDEILRTQSKQSENLQQEDADGMTKVRYSLVEKREGYEQPAIYLFGITQKSEIHMGIYYDEEKDLPEVEKIWQTFLYTPAEAP